MKEPFKDMSRLPWLGATVFIGVTFATFAVAKSVLKLSTDAITLWATLANAIAVLTTVVVATRAIAANSSLQRQAAYQRLHERLIEPDVAKGRRLLIMTHHARLAREATGETIPLGYEGRDPAKARPDYAYPLPTDEDWDLVNHSLALLDTLGYYLKSGLIDQGTFAESWRTPLQNLRDPLLEFQKHRYALNIHQPWSYLSGMMEEIPNHEENTGKNLISRGTILRPHNDPHTGRASRKR